VTGFGTALALAQAESWNVPKVNTQQFGLLEYRLEDAISFPLGLPAFEQETSFLLVAPAKTRPMVFLQSLGRPELCFVTLPLEVVDPNYQLAISAEDASVLELTERDLVAVGPVGGGPVECLAIVSLTNSCPTANLLAPVVIHSAKRKGLQAIRLDNRYSHQHPVEAVCS
jgi:flagellar assembly factor FliW